MHDAGRIAIRMKHTPCLLVSSGSHRRFVLERPVIVIAGASQPDHPAMLNVMVARQTVSLAARSGLMIYRGPVSARKGRNTLAVEAGERTGQGQRVFDPWRHLAAGRGPLLTSGSQPASFAAAIKQARGSRRAAGREKNRNAAGTRERIVCRSIKTLHNFQPPATNDEIRASALQFVRKLSGFRRASKVNEMAFNRAVDQVAGAARELLDALVTDAPPRDRKIEATRARAKAARRFAVSGPGHAG